MEKWLPIKGYEGRYEVSDYGRVRSLFKEIVMQQYKHYKGHMFLSLYDHEYGRKKYFVHRLVAMTFISNPENKECVNHKDENKQNNNVSNLEWMTSGENTRYSLPSRMMKRKIKMNTPVGMAMYGEGEIINGIAITTKVMVGTQREIKHKGKKIKLFIPKNL